jgi:cytochrome c oxidase subunit 1
LILAHFAMAFTVFALGLILGEWQMIVRSPLHAWVDDPEHYYRSVTAHGSALAYVFPTLLAMGFGYAISVTSLEQPLRGLRLAWAAFYLVVLGAVVAMVPVALGRASVLYTFYPPLIANAFYYIGIVLVVVGSWIWVGILHVNHRAWKSRHADAPLPLPMFANLAGAYLWGWTAVGAALEILLQILPVALKWRTTIDAGLARVLFSWTLHAIVYFWLIPTYIAYYAIVPRAIGSRLYSDTMGRLAFALFLVFAMPIGIHHLFADPMVGSGIKMMHTIFTAMVAVPTLLTIFTIAATVELAARARGGRGAFGWLKALPWDNPAMLGVAFSFILLGLGGAGGLINMSYQLDSTIHNTQWITGHFHLIFAGAIVIMYFIVAYDLWPHLTGRDLGPQALQRLQLWLWFLGMLVLSLPWHWAGLLNMPRRMAYFDYSAPAISPQAWTVVVSAIGGAIVLASGLLFVYILASSLRRAEIESPAYRFSEPLHPATAVPIALNGLGIWFALMVALTLVNYGFPIWQLAQQKETSVPAVYVGGGQ